MSSFSEVIETLGLEVVGDHYPQAPSGITMDSRQVVPGTMFACVRGAKFDGHDFAAKAVEAGATSLLVERRLDLDVAQVQTKDVRQALGPISSAVYGDPSSKLTVIGVTGTNGKSSVVQLLLDIFRAAGRNAEIYGTLTGERTTPEAPVLQQQLADSVARGIEIVAMEVSSHALEMARVDGTKFAVTAFTNLSHDHLDFHGSMEAYFQAKARLFDSTFSDVAVINADDEYGKRLLYSVNAIPFSLNDLASLQLEQTLSRFQWRNQDIELHLIGSHNVSNAIAAATIAAEVGIDDETIAAALSNSKPVKGRLDVVSTTQSFVVAVDYAHTPDALEAVIKAGREIAGTNRVITVFGCGGDRDAAKRPEMGRIASIGSDVAVLTTDNPRSEDPVLIAQAVLAGIDTSSEVLDIPDRAEAIHSAIAMANAGDVVLITGKGHETGQYVGDKVLEFDDLEVAKTALESTD